MKILFVGVPTVGSWSAAYFGVVISQLTEYGHIVETLPCNYIRLAGVPEKTPDVVFLMGDTEWDYSYWLDYAGLKGIPVVAHHHGGPELLGFVDWPAQEEFYRTFAGDIWRFSAIFFNSRYSLERFVQFYKVEGLSSKFIVTGFPVDDDVYTPGEKEPLILVPGRVANDRFPLIAAQALFPWRERVLFAAGTNPGMSYVQDEYLNTLRQWGFKVDFLVGDSYVEKVRKAKVGFIASLRDTLNTSLVECQMAGAITVAPDAMAFPEYIYGEYRYEPYSIRDIRRAVSLALYTADVPTEVERVRSLVNKFNKKDVVKSMEIVMSYFVKP